VDNPTKKNGAAAGLWVGLGVAGGLALYHLIAKMAADTAMRTTGRLPQRRETLDFYDDDIYV